MKNRTWKVAGVLGSILVLSTGSGTLVRAEEASTEVTNDNSADSVLETAAWENKAVANVETYANVRLEASEEAEKAGVMPKGASADVVSREEEWTKVSSGEVEGYVKTELLAFADEAKNIYEGTYGNQGTVTASSLRIRNAPSLDAQQIGSRGKGSKVEILGQEGDWYQIDNGDNGPAYMFAEHIEIEEATALTMEEYQEQKQEVSVSVSGGELDLLAAIIQCEAGGESHTGKVAVGAVIMNRVRSGQFPNTISEVVYQSGQFSPVASGKLASVLSQGARSDCYQAAQEALAGSNPIGGALYFNSGTGKGQQIGNQHFY
ncbi:MAG: cell wall hydrolase [Clostridiales bacterium]|nr:cell wall hydrolase [Clostridiales bacterium]